MQQREAPRAESAFTGNIRKLTLSGPNPVR